MYFSILCLSSSQELLGGFAWNVLPVGDFLLSKQFLVFAVRLVYLSIIRVLSTQVLRSTKH